MTIVLNITAESAEDLTETVLELAAIKRGSATAGGLLGAQSIEEMLDALKKKLLPQGLTVVVKNKVRDQGVTSLPSVPGDAAINNGAEAEATEPEPEPEDEDETATVTPLPATKKKSPGGATKLPKEAARAALAEAPAARKARCIATLQTMFNDGRKKEVAEILAKYGDGIKNFAAIPEASFAGISDALAAME